MFILMINVCPLESTLQIRMHPLKHQKKAFKVVNKIMQLICYTMLSSKDLVFLKYSFRKSTLVGEEVMKWATQI